MAGEDRGVVYFAHGKESGPWGIKIRALAEVAESHGFAVESPDYSGLSDADERVAALLAIAPAATGPLVLVGSSMGAYVSLVASTTVKVDGLFLMAPAVGLPGYRIADPAPRAPTTVIVHGWYDELIPVEQVVRYSCRHGVTLHIVPGTHRLDDQIPFLAAQFSLLLDEVSRRHR